MIREVHDLEPPDRFCLGDDPCVCEQLQQARAEAIALFKKYSQARCTHCGGPQYGQ